MRTRSYAIFSAQYPPHLGGIENFSHNLARTLVSRGNAVTVVTNDTNGIGSGIVQEDGVGVVRLPCLPLVAGRFPLTKHNSAYRFLMKHLRDTPVDGVLVNARFYPHSLLGMRYARERGLTPIVLDHGSAWLSFSNPLLDPAVRLYERAITTWGKRYDPAYYGISRKSMEWLGNFHIDAQGIIPNAIDAPAFRASASDRNLRNEIGASDDRFVVAFVGRLIPEKGVRSLIEASYDQRLMRAGITFILAGDGTLGEEVRAAESQRLRWVGRLDSKDTAALLMQANLLCLPTRSEGFSTVLLEASACGCPSLVTDVGGARDIICDDDHGQILEDTSPATIVQSVLSLSKMQDELREMGERCRRRVEELFTWDAAASAFESASERAR